MVGGDAGAKDLAKLTKLVRLNLDKSRITDAALEQLKGLANVEWMHLGSNAISNEGLEHLQGLPKLKEVIVTRCPKVTPDGVEKLKKAMPSNQPV